MNGDRWRRVEELYHAALQRDVAERSEFLTRICGGDRELLREVESLLAYDEEPGEVLDRPAWDALSGAATAVKLPVLAAGAAFGSYRIVERLGAGGMGEVYRAVDTRLTREAAIKVLAPEMAGDPEWRQRFLREAQAASRLNDPHIVTIYDIGEVDGVHFIAMEYVPGRPLSQVIPEGGMEPRRAARYAAQIAGALAKAHAAGIVHRDVKPGNIVISTEDSVKVLDFGLAKLNAAPAADSPAVTATHAGVVMGSAAYMSPEQAAGRPVDARSDIFSWGLVLYEMLSGRRAFREDSRFSTMAAILHKEPEALPAQVPQDLAEIQARAMRKDPAERFASMAEAASALDAVMPSLPDTRTASQPGQAVSERRTVEPHDTTTIHLSRPARWVAAALVAALAASVGWYALRQRRVRWVREVAIPEIARLAAAETNGAAMAVARDAMAYLPGDPALAELWDRISANVSIETEPAGATVEVKDYLTPLAPWTTVGKTPLHKARFPWGYSRVRISAPGRETFEFAHQVQAEISPDLHLKLEAAGAWPDGMVKVPVRRLLSGVATIQVQAVTSEFYIDRFEVSNGEYQKFVDAGGYRNPRFWKEEFVRDGKRLDRAEAIKQFVDTTNEPGPATWVAGRYPEGKGDLPVMGVSWYEAAAYAEFAGKNLPSVSYWYAAALPSVSPAVIRLSNFDEIGPAPRGKYPGVSAGGALDMAGNVKEWCWNATGAKRYILGGSWRDPAYQATAPDAQDPFNRMPDNGFRCIRYIQPPDAAMLAPMPRVMRDYAKEKPVSDDVFRGFQALYAYEHSSPEGRVETVDASNADWIRQRVSYAAGHDRERMPAVLFLPKHGAPPFQVVVYFPGIGAMLYPDSQHDLVAFYQLDYLVRGGRAVLCPVYDGTYERRALRPLTRIEQRDREINWAKEIERSLDYLETRNDIDKEKMAFLGFSLGGRPAVRLAAYTPRVKTCLILSSGLVPGQIDPEVDPFNFAPRLKIPTLLLDGKYDFTFPVEEYQRPLMRLLGTPEKDKKYVLLEYAHNVGAMPTEMRREVLGWLDQYLGAVK